MKLLLTNDELHEVRGGTQVFIADLARSLRERGHEIAVYAWLRGSLADELNNAGVPVVASPRECGFVPDLIHGQHHLSAMTGLCAFPGVPAIYHCHGYGPWQERPPSHPRILHYLTTAEAMLDWIAVTAGCKRDEVIVLPNSINLHRFHRVRRPGLHPRRALLFGNSFVPPDSISKLKRACARCGMTLDLVGAQFDNATGSPQDALPDYDLVFAVGRSALEAMACGCAVVLFSAAGCGPMIRPQNLGSFMKRNLTVPESVPSVTVKDLTARIKEFDAGCAAQATAAVRDEFSFERTCDRLETLYRRTLDAWRDQPRSSAESESHALSAYLASLGTYVKGADERFVTLRLNREKSKQRIGRLKLKLAGMEKKWELLKRRLPGIIRHWLLREGP